MYKGRDVEITAIDPDQFLVAACDSCGGVGGKELDLVKVPPYVVGRFTARVALLEIMSIGALPQMLTAAVTCEPYPTGKEMVAGIEDELSATGFSGLPVGISTEKNIQTRQTGLGVTVVGICQRDRLRIAAAKPGDRVFCLGLPKVGNEVKCHDDPFIIQGSHIQKLLKNPAIHDIVPVGSQGIRAEAVQLASTIGIEFKPTHGHQINLDKSGGPSTCLIFTCAPECIPDRFNLTPVTEIGCMI